MSFFTSETGAVTVDWVVLTAGLVGLGLATMGVVSTGVQDTSGDIDTALRGSNIITSSFSTAYTPIPCNPETATEVAHAGLYCAMHERASFYPEGDAFADGQLQFDYMVNYFTNASAADLALWTSEGETVVVPYVERVALYDSMIGTGLSEAEAMAQLGIPEINRWTGEPNSLGGDVDAYLWNRRAQDNAIIEIQETRKIVAEERGIDWQS